MNLVFILIGSLLKAKVSYFPYNSCSKGKMEDVAFLTDKCQTYLVCPCHECGDSGEDRAKTEGVHQLRKGNLELTHQYVTCRNKEVKVL